MRTRGFVANDRQQVRLLEIELPEPGPEDLAVRTICSGVSIGTERLWLAEQTQDGKAPLSTGYQAVGVVEQAGDAVTGFAPGDRVAYRGPASSALAATGEPILNCRGAHSAHAVFPAREAVAVPPGVDAAPASLFVVFCTGMHGMDRARPGVGDWLVVHGCGLVGLGVVAVARLHGCNVIAIDQESHRLDVARRLGADETFDVRSTDIVEAVMSITADGAHAVFEATGVPRCLPVATELCRRHATFVFQGNYGGETHVQHRFGDGHGKELTMIHTCGYGQNPCTVAFLKLLAGGLVPWGSTITHRCQAEEAEALLDDVLNRRVADVLGMFIDWSSE
jgi:2-desacetyl-2-hydroxyethyl bacteriochlorophyllide A dehydrogenase